MPWSVQRRVQRRAGEWQVSWFGPGFIVALVSAPALTGRAGRLQCNTARERRGQVAHYTGSLSKYWLLVPLLVVYLSSLGRVGFLGPDEPRYASIGRAM